MNVESIKANTAIKGFIVIFLVVALVGAVVYSTRADSTVKDIEWTSQGEEDLEQNLKDVGVEDLEDFEELNDEEQEQIEAEIDPSIIVYVGGEMGLLDQYGKVVLLRPIGAMMMGGDTVTQVFFSFQVIVKGYGNIWWNSLQGSYQVYVGFSELMSPILGMSDSFSFMIDGDTALTAVLRVQENIEAVLSNFGQQMYDGWTSDAHFKLQVQVRVSGQSGNMEMEKIIRQDVDAGFVARGLKYVVPKAIEPTTVTEPPTTVLETTTLPAQTITVPGDTITIPPQTVIETITLEPEIIFLPPRTVTTTEHSPEPIVTQEPYHEPGFTLEAILEQT